MKLVKSISAFVLFALVTACGSSQPVGTMGYQYGSNFNPQTTGGYNGYGYNSYGSSGSQPLYANGALIGYKTQTPLFNGTVEVPAQLISNYVLPYSAQVNAGEKVLMDLSRSNYEVYRTSCWYVFNITSNMRKNYSIPGGELMLNGQVLPNGAVAPTSGTLTFKPNLSPLSASCNIMTYGVYLSNAVYKESCTNTSGQLMNCP
jgi:hypothetical protein